MSAAIIKTEASQKRRNFVSKFLIYFFLIVITACMLLPFLWMLSSSFKLNKDVFGFPIQWIPKNPRWQNYVDIWTQIPLLTFVKNTVKITVVVTLLQLFTSSFAAYAFAKMQFKGKNALFLGYIATIAVPWQAYMVPQFMMMSSWHLNNTHLAIMCLQAFSAFGVFLMKQFYEGVPTELCEAARIDGLSEYGIWWHIMLPLSLPALSTLTIFTFVNTWNDFLGPLIYLTKTELKTIQIGLRMFITQYSAEYGLCGGTDPGADRVPLPAEVFCAGRGIHRHQGLNKSPVSGAWAVPAPRIFCRNREKVLCYILNRMKHA